MTERSNTAERRIAILELARDADEYEDLYQRAPCGYFTTTGDGRLLRVNDTFLEWTGYARDAVLGRAFTTILSRPGQIFHDTHYAPLLAIRGWVREMAFDLVRADGEDLPVLLSAVAHRGDDGAIESIRVVVTEASDRRAYERELLRARRAAEEAAAGKNELLTRVCHEMVGSLRNLAMAGEDLAGTRLDTDQRRLLLLMNNTSRRLLTMASAFLERSQLDAGITAWISETFDLRASLVAATEELSLRAEMKGLFFALDVAPELPERLIGDRQKIEQIVTTLVSNAIRFTVQGGVTVSLQIARLTVDTASFQLRVRDTGAGISAGRLAAIFDEPEAAGGEDEVPGVALGLSVARRLARLTGGDLSAESEPGAGSTFTLALRLPIARTRS